MTKEDGGAAFPYGKDTHETIAGDWKGNPCMSLRDYLAGQALVAMGTWSPGKFGDIRGKNALLGRARWAYDQADAMLEARQFTEEKQ